MDLCRRIVREEADLAAETLGRKPLGAEKVLTMDPHYRPDRAESSPAPMVHCRDSAARKAWKSAYALFVRAYHATVDAMRAGIEQFRFPAGCIPPGTRLAATAAGDASEDIVT